MKNRRHICLLTVMGMLLVSVGRVRARYQLAVDRWGVLRLVVAVFIFQIAALGHSGAGETIGVQIAKMALYNAAEWPFALSRDGAGEVE